MKRDKKNLFVGLCVLIIVAFLSGTAISGKTMTITGTVNENYQIVADDGQVYEVADTEKGDEVVDLVGKKVKVTGTVEESYGEKVITMTSYEVIGEKTVTIVGTINADYRIVTDDGQVYEVEDNEKGGELIELVGKKVRVMGMIGEYEGTKIILVTSYEVIGK